MLGGVRFALDTILDQVRFRLDTLLFMDYQPLPWLGILKARRSGGVESRCQIIVDMLQRLRVVTVLDIGCNVGYFSLSLAELGVTVVGVDNSSRCHRIFLYVLKKLKYGNVGVLYMKMTPGRIGS